MRGTLRRASWALVLLLVTAGPGRASWLERVPEDGTLQEALDQVADGGVVEIAGGVYAAPAGGFWIDDPRRFTVRARQGERVVLDGQGRGPILVYRGAGSDTLRFVSFEGLTLSRGLSTDPERGGAVTVANARAVFVDCTFEQNVNAALGAGGGAVQVREHSQVRFVRSRLLDNSARQWGGALFVFGDSRVDLVWSEMVGNRVNLPGHGSFAVGGAVYLLDSRLTAFGVRFEANEAGWGGGAIYAFGTWREPLDAPSTQVDLVSSSFLHNAAGPDACSSAPGSPSGGAIHLADHATLRIDDSRFLGNVATFGGALSIYRALAEVDDSVFRGNRATPWGNVLAAGGAINLTSADFVDSSTGQGAINRRPAAILLRRSLLQGRFGDAGVAAQQGGCLFAAGDVNRQTGAGGVLQNGTAAENRARVTLEGVILSDCDVQTTPLGSGLGGAVFANLADLRISSSLVVDSDALGSNTFGGGILLLGDSALRLTDSAFARNTATFSGGAVRANGGSVEIERSLFVDNDVSPGIAEPVDSADASALALAPGESQDITGRVADSVFSGNRDLPIVDTDFVQGPFNRVVYDGNRIHSTSFGNRVYKNLAVGWGGLSVEGLNELVLPRPDGTTTVKSQVDNLLLAASPRAGALVAAPARLGTFTAAGEDTAPAAFLGFAASGGAVQLAGQSPASSAGVVEVTSPGTYDLRVGGAVAATATVAARVCGDGRVLCLNRERFLLEADWQDHAGRIGEAVPRTVAADDSGFFWFFSDTNLELVVKVLDGCWVNERFWVFAAGLTDVAVSLRITDTWTGAVRTYENPRGTAFQPIQDTSAFATCGASQVVAASGAGEMRPVEEEPSAGIGVDTLAPLATAGGDSTGSDITSGGAPGVQGKTLLLNGDRFAVNVHWRIASGSSGEGTPVALTSDSGYFWFFDSGNIELVVKVLDGCGVNQKFWVFAGGLTDVEVTMTVRDTSSGETRTYSNPLGTRFRPITDTSAFAACGSS